MLGDNPEKSRNPLKKAMRRRNAKTVTFTDPTYYEPSERTYSSEEEEEEEQEFLTVADAAREEEDAQQDQNGSATVEPLKIRGNQKENTNGVDDGVDSRTQQNERTTELRESRGRSSSDISDPSGMLRPRLYM